MRYAAVLVMAGVLWSWPVASAQQASAPVKAPQAKASAIEVPTLPKKDHFTQLWGFRRYRNNPRYRLYLIRIISTKPVRIRLLSLLSMKDKSFAMQEITPTVSGIKIPLASKGKVFIACVITYRQVVRKKQTTAWRLQAIPNFARRDPITGRTTRVANAPKMIEISFAEQDYVKAIRELLFNVSPAGTDPDLLFDRMVYYLSCPDPAARSLAANYGAQIGPGTGSQKNAILPDRFARLVLKADAQARRGLAGAYLRATSDILPRDGELLSALLGHSDLATAELAATNVAHLKARGKDTVGLLRGFLSRPDKSQPLRRAWNLVPLRAWGAGVLVFAKSLEAKARGADASQAQRVGALGLLLDNGAPGSRELLLATLSEVPSAVALQYAVDNRVHAVVPAVIEACRAGKIKWNANYANALTLLTGKAAGGSFEQFDAWWKQIEKTRGAEEAIANGFADPQLNARCARLIEQLTSDSFAERTKARKELRDSINTQLPTSVAQAADSDDYEVANTVRELKEQIDRSLKAHRDALAAQITLERAGKATTKSAESDTDTGVVRARLNIQAAGGGVRIIRQVGAGANVQIIFQGGNGVVTIVDKTAPKAVKGKAAASQPVGNGATRVIRK